MVEASPTNIREVIAGQRSVPHAYAALLRGLCAMIYTASDTGNMAPLVALADDIAGNPSAWASALTQNTPAAADVTALEMDMARVPTGMTSAFTTPGTRRVVDTAAEDKAAADKAAADKAAADKTAADRATSDRQRSEQATRDRANAQRQTEQNAQNKDASG
jgi:hypothetical protein